MRIVILTGSELRHTYFRKKFSSEKQFHVCRSICESKKGSIESRIAAEVTDNSMRTFHLHERKKSEVQFFSSYISNTKDKSNPLFIEKGTLNNNSIVSSIINENPDFIIAYGCSIISSDLLEHFKNRIINIHLGLSPYYRGSGTNFWPFYHKELQYIGVTFMYMDRGIDTGEIIHQIQADFKLDDTISAVGNRLIVKMTDECIKLMRNLNNLKKLNLIPSEFPRRYFSKKDFSEESVKVAYQNVSAGLVHHYLNNASVVVKLVRQQLI